MTDTVSFQTTLRVRDHCLCLAAHRAARALSRRFDQALRECGLTHGQFSLLMSVNRPEPAPLADVSRLLGVDRTTLTAALKPLVRDGRIEVLVDATDRRARRLRLTGEGQRALVRALPIWQQTHALLDAELAQADPDDAATGGDAAPQAGAPQAGAPLGLDASLRRGLAVLAGATMAAPSFPARKGHLP